MFRISAIEGVGIIAAIGIAIASGKFISEVFQTFTSILQSMPI